MADIFARYPGAVGRAAVIGVECAFDLALVAPDLPPFPVPEGRTEATYLRELTWAGADRRYGPRDRNPQAYAQLKHELTVIEELGFPGYFLVKFSWTTIDTSWSRDGPHLTTLHSRTTGRNGGNGWQFRWTATTCACSPSRTHDVRSAVTTC